MIATKIKRRKAIPDRVKLLAKLREMGLMIREVEYDHLQASRADLISEPMRAWDI